MSSDTQANHQQSHVRQQQFVGHCGLPLPDRVSLSQMWGAIPATPNASTDQTPWPRKNLNGGHPFDAIQSIECAGLGCLAQGSQCQYQDQLLILCGQPLWPNAKLEQQAKQYGPAYAFYQLSKQEEQGIESALALMSGHFSLIGWNAATSTLILATDRFNQWPLYYQPFPSEGPCSQLYFSSSLAALQRPLLSGLKQSAAGEVEAPIQPNLLAPQAIHDYLYFHTLPSPNTCYQGIYKLPAGHCLYAQLEQSSVTSKRYWQPAFKESSTSLKRHHYPRVRSILRHSIEQTCRANSGRCAAFLSGGLDSSSVAGTLAELAFERGERAQAYTIGFNAEGYDEVPYARITAEHFELDLHEYYVTPADVVEALPKIAASFDEPFGNSSALPAYFCAQQAAKDGVKLLLAGDGGDELFAGNERYQKQALFEHYQRLPRGLRHGVIEPLLQYLPQPPFKKLHSYIRQSNIQLPERLEYYNFLHQHTPTNIWHADLLAQINTQRPLQHQRSVYAEPQQASCLNRMLYLDWKLTLADNDLKKVGSMCQLAGIDVHYPMLHSELVDLSCELPSRWKLKGRQLRHFYRESVRGWLPDATLSKSKKGFGLPFGVWLREYPALQELAYSSLNQLKNRGYFNPDFIEQCINHHQQEHAAYYGELIWLLMMFELWLQSHIDRPGEKKTSENSANTGN